MAELFAWVMILLIYMGPGYVCVWGWSDMFNDILSRKRRVAARMGMLIAWPIWLVVVAVVFIAAAVCFFVKEILK